MTDPIKRGPLVIVFAKNPAPGHAKTRLSPPLTPAAAAELASCFAIDTVDSALTVCKVVMIAYAGGDDLLRALLPIGLVWREQPDGDLGNRIEKAMADACSGGYVLVIVIGTDSPSLPPAYISQAIDMLMSNAVDCVLGPAVDGGFYLLGLNRWSPGIFEGVTWSAADTGARTCDNARRLGLRLRLLPPWYDVDTAEDLARLKGDCESDAGLRRRMPSTYAWMRLNLPSTTGASEDVRPCTGARGASG